MQPMLPTQAAPPATAPEQLDPDLQRYLRDTGLDLVLLQEQMLTNVDRDLGPMRNWDICDIAAARFGQYRDRHDEFEAGKEALRNEIGQAAFDDLARRAFDVVLPSMMAQKSCQFGEVRFNSNEYLQQRLTPADTIKNCKPLAVPYWLIQAVIDSKRDMKVVDLVCLDIERLSIYGKKLDLLRVSGSRISNYTVNFSEIAGSFVFEGCTTDNIFEVRWNTIKDVYVNWVTAPSNTGSEMFSIQNNTIGNGLEINNLTFGRKPGGSKGQHEQPMTVAANRVGSELTIVRSEINGNLHLIDTTANSIRIEDTDVAGSIFIEQASAEKVITFRNGKADEGVFGHYLHADGIEFRSFNSARSVDLRSSQFADKILFDDVTIDRVALHDVTTRPLLIYDTRVSNYDLQGLSADLVMVGSNGPEGNRIGWFALNDGKIDNTLLISNAYFVRGLSLANTQIGNSFSMTSERVLFQDTARLDIRGLKTDGLNIELSALKTIDRDGKRDQPLLIESHGAVFSRFGTFSESGKDLSDLEVPDLLRHFMLASGEEKKPGQAAAAAEAAAPTAAPAPAEASPVPEAGSNPPAQKAADGPSYRAAEFDQLAAVLERSGRGDKARDVKIAKNRAYARTSDSRLTQAIYSIAGFVNGYGYNNQFALLLYFACVLVGMMLFWLWLNAHPIILTARLARSPDALWSKRRLMRRIGHLRRKRLPPDEGRSLGVHRRNGGLIYAFFFSLDRSLPPLNLDSAFATHEGMWRPLAYWFFFQRAFCFLVISLVLAGSLGMFQ